MKRRHRHSLYFREYYGPLNRTFAALDEAGRAALRRDLEAHWAAHNRAGAQATHVESQYLEVTALRR